METTFANWLLAELEKRGMTQIELSRKSGVTAPQISRILSGQRGAEGKTLSDIAHALKLPPEEVYRAAGLLPPARENNLIVQQIEYITSDLPPEEQENILEYARLRLRISEQKGKYNDKPTSHSRPSQSR